MIRISSYGNATNAQMIKLKSALDLCNVCNVSLAFKDKVMTAKFTSTTKTNAEIYADTQKDVSISVSFYTPTWWDRFKSWVTKKDIVAAESGAGNVTFNSVVFAQNALPQLSGTIRHEALHPPAAGNYKHDFLETPQRKYSVPYQCQSFIEQIAAGMNF